MLRATPRTAEARRRAGAHDASAGDGVLKFSDPGLIMRTKYGTPPFPANRVGNVTTPADKATVTGEYSCTVTI
jgi:hypothetical protein